MWTIPAHMVWKPKQLDEDSALDWQAAIMLLDYTEMAGIYRRKEELDLLYQQKDDCRGICR